MKRFWMFCLLALALPVVAAQETVPEGFEHWTADSFKQLNQTLKPEAEKNAHHIAVQRLEDFANDTFMLSRREVRRRSRMDENQADVFFVQSGSAALVVAHDGAWGDA